MKFRVAVVCKDSDGKLIKALSDALDIVPACQLVEWLRRRFPIVCMVPGAVDPKKFNGVINAKHEFAMRAKFTVDALCSHLGKRVADFAHAPTDIVSWVAAGAEHIKQMADEQIAAARPQRYPLSCSMN